MTAEIAILNKNAVALAADSAVTLRNSDTQKVYNTANKLFMLSKYHPVGIMVYGSADLMGTPWETVIKMYRAELGTKNFDKLIDFAEHFFGFIEGSNLLFPPSLQESTYSGMCRWILHQLKEQIDLAVQAEIKANNGIDDDGVARVVAAAVDSELRNWEQLRRLECFPDDYETQILTAHSVALRALFDEVFLQLPIEPVRDKLLQICAYRSTKDWWSLNNSGVVVAGFGSKEFLPVLHSYTVEAVLRHRLKRDRQSRLSNDIGESGGASIIPFAQAEIVYRFIRGIDPDYRREISTLLRNLLTEQYPNKITEDFQDRVAEEDRRNAKAELIRIGRAVIESFDNEWGEWEHRKFVGPVLDIVGDLPKDELAAMAESLVNLTSFKRRITAEAETVGGPIDVAVISKGDGFVWIKRKHYFHKDLNPAFFANYYRRERDGQ
jgi:hypothetical protein